MRRDFVTVIAFGFGVLSLSWSMGQQALAGQPEATVERAANLVVTENRKPGATDWQLTRVRADGDGFRSPWIEGYCSKQSVRAGETSVRTIPGRLTTVGRTTFRWVTPYRDSRDGRTNRIIFRGGPYGADNDYARRRQKENGPFPEHGPDEGLLMGGRNVEPVNGGGDWVVAKAEHWMFEGTALKNGDRIPGLIGWEYHGDPPKLSGLER